MSNILLCAAVASVLLAAPPASSSAKQDTPGAAHPKESPTAAAAAPSPDPDHGNARAYFRGIELEPFAYEPTGEKAKNVVWIVVDAMRPDHMGTYGYAKPTTPFLDSLAEDSFVFLHSYVNAPWTRPSTASMLTGLLPSKHRTQTDKSKLPADVRTIAQDFAAMGYETAGIVANGNGSSIAELDRGFSHYVDPAGAFQKLPSAGQVYDEALKWLKTGRDTKKPFFLFIFVVDPHDPYRAPPDYEKKWLPKGFEGEPRRRAHWEYKNDYPEAERQSMIAVYDAAIRYTDDQTRRFFGELDALKLLDDLTWVVTADHGDGFGEHGYYLHAHHHYDEIVRVPLIVRTPAWKGGGHVFHPVQSVDLLPTLVTAAGGKPRDDLSGADIGAMLGKPVDRTRRIVSEYNEFGIRRSAMLDLRYRVILQLPADKERFLERIPNPALLPSVNFEWEVLHAYDRVKDPLEKTNLAPKDLPPEAKAMADDLRKHMKAVPPSNEPLKAERVPVGVEENLKSLGYVE